MTDSFTARLRARFDHWLRTAPPTRLIVSSFLLVVALGTLLLLLPFSTKAPLKPLDALFTAVSATCVTGLVAVDTYSTFTGFGQAVVLAMIQIGGLGLVTFASFFTLSFTRRQDYRTLQLAGESVSSSGLAEAQGLLSMVVRLAAGFELAGALLMLPVFVPQYGPEGIWIAFFLAISAFCNAGFDILGRTVPYASLTGYVHNWYVQAVLMFLIIAGGLGFIVWVDLMEWPKERYSAKSFEEAAKNGTTCIVEKSEVMEHSGWRIAMWISAGLLLFSAVLTLGGALCFALLEWRNPATLGALSGPDAAMASLFQSVSARTAGLNTVDLASLFSLTKLLMCILMFIGAAPGGTGGGIKVTTVSVLLVTVLCVARGQEDAVMFGHRIGKKTVYRALTILLGGLGAVAVAAVAMFYNTSSAVSEIDSMFEAFSAFATVGLSVGVTATMQATAKLVTILTMFVGRVGPVALAISLAGSTPPSAARAVLPEGHVNVG